MLPVNAFNVRGKEQANDGAHIYLYYEKNSAVWMAYGKSAYLLRMFVENISSDSLSVFSDSQELPCTLIDDDTAKKARSLSNVVSYEERSSACLTGCGTINNAQYEQWVDKLKQIKVINGDEIVTPVSQFVPKNTYIADGMSSFTRNMKRMSDCILALIAMIVFSPLYLICYILIRREDGGPAIYKQERIGRFGRPFYIYKFRSMRMDAEKMGPQLSVAGGVSDPRLTKIGKILRSHHIDELPQLYNVFIGDMSFVGPRPERKYYIDQIMEYDKRYVYLYQIRPGVTSLATLYNGYTDTMAKMLCRLEYDLYYLGHRSWWLDMKLLFKTFCRIVFGKIF